MLINVPQNIDVEDKIVSFLTVKQLLWMIGMGVVLFVFWSMFPKIIFFTVGIPVALLCVAFAFYKPFGQPLLGFTLAGFKYMFGPKIYVWKRTPQRMQVNFQQKQIDATKKQAVESQEERRKKALDNLSGIAKIIDSEGKDANQDVISILKKIEKK